MKSCLNIVATGEMHRQMARLAADSLRLTGYADTLRIYADGPVDLSYATDAELRQVSNSSIADAKRLKIEAMNDTDGFDLVALIDADCLTTANITPILRRALDGQIYAAYATRTRLVHSRLKALYQDDAEILSRRLIDTYLLAVAPTPANKALLARWLDVFWPTGELIDFFSDCHAFNRALVEMDRYADVRIIPEAERLNGKPSPTTTIHHYVYGQHSRMPSHFRAWVEEPFHKSLTCP